MITDHVRSIHTLRIALAVIGAGNVLPGQTADDHMSCAGTEITQTQIADGIHQFTTVRGGHVRQLSSAVIVNDSDVLVFDTNTRPSSARLILMAPPAAIRHVRPQMATVQEREPDWLRDRGGGPSMATLRIVDGPGKQGNRQDQSLAKAKK